MAQSSVARAPRATTPAAPTWIDSLIDRPKPGRRISEIKDELGTEMNRNVAVFREQEGLEQLAAAVEAGDTDPYTAADRLLQP